jgi:hypothetical protein
MQLSPQVAIAYLDRAFDQILEVARRVDPSQLTTRPCGDHTNSISALVVHCTELTEFWLGHVGLGEPTDRDRASEFDYEAELPELEARVAAAVDASRRHVERLEAEGGRPSEARAFLYGDESDGALVLHVLEELYQHLGHMELTADALAAR